MKKSTDLFVLFLSASTAVAFSQDLTQLEGKVVATDDVEGIHILNKNSERYTVTDETGKFSIEAKINDTLIVSGVKYYTQRITVDQEILKNQSVSVQLEEFVNELDEVVVGKVLSGDLTRDINVTETKIDINFYDVGIPGYTGPRKTQSERRLYEATSGGRLIPLFPIINAITGRTKELKEQVKLQKKDRYMDMAMAKFSDLLFEDDVGRSDIIQFFLFDSDDVNFLLNWHGKNELKFFDFLMQKKSQFIERQSGVEKD